MFIYTGYSENSETAEATDSVQPLGLEWSQKSFQEIGDFHRPIVSGVVKCPNCFFFHPTKKGI